MADKDNENIEATTTENVDANEAVSDESSSAEAPEEVTDSPASSEDLSSEEALESEVPLEEVEEVHSTDEVPVEEQAEEAAPVSVDEKTPAQIIESFEASQLKEDIPSFRPGDTVVVSVKVREGDRTRLQAFEGVVMNIKSAGLNSAFIVRKISSGIGVERTFQLHSPMIDSITVKRKGDVRQAKLYYLRERSGRSARIKERLD